jgi:hypothetical protein
MEEQAQAKTARKVQTVFVENVAEGAGRRTRDSRHGTSKVWV